MLKVSISPSGHIDLAARKEKVVPYPIEKM
jgi:hypothetical protein